MTFTVLIPARLASTRLPNKPLADIAGVPMIVRVARQMDALRDNGVRTVVVTDSAEIAEVCHVHQVEALITRVEHPSGTDRLAEACELLKLESQDLVVNVQGDEPLMTADLVQSVADCLRADPGASMSTAAHALADVRELVNPNVVKVVTNHASQALYFSRAPIPWWRDGYAKSVDDFYPAGKPLRHIGIYAYKVDFLKNFPLLRQAPLEHIEALEQLRALWNGYAIAVHVTKDSPGPGVDTAEDLEIVRRLIAQRA